MKITIGDTMATVEASSVQEIRVIHEVCTTLFKEFGAEIVVRQKELMAKFPKNLYNEFVERVKNRGMIVA